MERYSLISTISYTGTAIIIIVGICFENNLGRSTNIFLAFLEALFLITIVFIEFKKKRRQ